MTIEQLSNYSETVFKHDGETYTVKYNLDSGKLSLFAEIQQMDIDLSKKAFNHIAKWLDRQPSPVDLEREALIEQIHNLYTRVVTRAVPVDTLGEYKGYLYQYHYLGQDAYWSIMSTDKTLLDTTFTFFDTADWLLEHTKDG